MIWRCNNSDLGLVEFPPDISSRSLVKVIQGWQLLSTDLGYRIRKLHSDPHSVFISDQFIEEMKTMEIGVTFGPPGQHWANGLIEDFIKVIEYSGMAMLLASGLSIWYWSFAFRYAVWLSNQVIRRKRHRLPFIYGVKPYDYVHKKGFGRVKGAFGQLVIARKPDANELNKLVPRGRRCAFLGFSGRERHECAILLHLESGKIIYSRDYHLVHDTMAITMKPIVNSETTVIGSAMNHPTIGATSITPS
jgi:hypothetical protein